MTRPFGFSKRDRLKAKDEIDRVFSQGAYHRLGQLQAKCLLSGRERARFMISVRKSVGTAPARNRIKRMVREAFRQHRERLRIPHDICFFLTRRPPRPLNFTMVEKEILDLFDRLSRPSESMASHG